jgi:tetratricopeptide (TPR) repeat protein
MRAADTLGEMESPTAELQQRAIEYAKSGDFGPQALETNRELARIAPNNEGAWTRLGRCLLESGRLDEATEALESALRLNPQNTIARNLRLEVSKRREGATAGAAALRRPPRRSPRPSSSATRERPARTGIGGFGRPEFAALGHLPPATALETLTPRIEPLLIALNDRPFAAKAVEARNRAAHAGSRLYRRNSLYEGGPGHLYAYQHGGRWEPQFNVGFFAGPRWRRDAVRAGIGFNLAQDRTDLEREGGGQERALAHFARFQQLVSREWRQLLTAWMSKNGGFIQVGDQPPATDLMPADAIGSLVALETPLEDEWVFCGAWLFSDRSDHAEVLADGGLLIRWLEGAFTDLLPLWTSVYRG